MGDQSGASPEILLRDRGAPTVSLADYQGTQGQNPFRFGFDFSQSAHSWILGRDRPSTRKSQALCTPSPAGDIFLALKTSLASGIGPRAASAGQ